MWPLWAITAQPSWWRKHFSWSPHFNIFLLTLTVWLCISVNSLVPSPQLLWQKQWGEAVGSLQSHLFSRMSQLWSLSLSSHGRCTIMTVPCWTHSSFFDVFPVFKRPKQATVSKCALMSEEDNPFSWSTNSTYLKRAQGAVSHLCCQNTVGSYLPAICNISFRHSCSPQSVTCFASFPGTGLHIWPCLSFSHDRVNFFTGKVVCPDSTVTQYHLMSCAMGRTKGFFLISGQGKMWYGGEEQVGILPWFFPANSFFLLHLLFLILLLLLFLILSHCCFPVNCSYLNL